MVFYGHVAGKGRSVGQNAVAADDAVVADVGVGHDEAVAADARSAAAALSPAGNGHAFPDGVVVPHLEARGFSVVLQILWSNAHRGERIDPVARAETRFAVEHHMRDQFAVFAQLDIRTDRAKGAHA